MFVSAVGSTLGSSKLQRAKLNLTISKWLLQFLDVWTDRTVAVGFLRLVLPTRCESLSGALWARHVPNPTNTISQRRRLSSTPVRRELLRSRMAADALDFHCRLAVLFSFDDKGLITGLTNTLKRWRLVKQSLTVKAVFEGCVLSSWESWLSYNQQH